MKPRLPRRRETPKRDTMPPEVPEVSDVARPSPDAEPDPIPEHIRRMLEAAYT